MRSKFPYVLTLLLIAATSGLTGAISLHLLDHGLRVWFGLFSVALIVCAVVFAFWLRGVFSQAVSRPVPSLPLSLPVTLCLMIGVCVFTLVRL
jgi:hypothetical protein